MEKKQVIIFINILIISLKGFTQNISWEDMNLKTAKELHARSYVIEGDVKLFNEKFSGSDYTNINSERLYLFDRIDDTFLFQAISEDGDKGYVNVSLIHFITDSYYDSESELIKNNPFFNRFGPLLVFDNGKIERIFENKQDLIYGDSGYNWKLKYFDEHLFVVLCSEMEGGRWYYYPLSNLEQRIESYSIPTYNKKHNIAISAGKPWPPGPLHLSVHDVSDNFNVNFNNDIYGIPLNTRWKVSSLDDAFLIEIENGDVIIISINEDNNPERVFKLTQPVPLTGQSGVVNDGPLRIREHPDTYCKIIGNLNKNEKVDFLYRTKENRHYE